MEKDEDDKQEKKEADGEGKEGKNDKDEEEVEEKEGTWAPFTPAGCYLLHFTPSLTPFWLPAGSDLLPNWPPAAVLSWPLPLSFFLHCCLTSFALIVPLPRQSPAAAPVREPVCLVVGRRRLPLGECVALQLV